MRKYNYFDDDEDDILEEIRTRVRESDTPDENRTYDKGEVLDAIRAFSLRSGDKIISAAKSALQKNPIEELERIARTRKRTVTLTMVFVFFAFLAIMIAATVHSVNVENKRIAKFDAAAGKVCSQYITKYGNPNYENLYNTYGVSGYRMTGFCYAREIDFDNDNKSELLLSYNDSGVYYTEVWGYDNDNEFVNLFKEKATQSEDKTEDAWITMYSKNNRYYIGVHDEKDISKVALYALRGEKFEKRNTCEYDAEAQAFLVKKKVDPVSFERIKLAVLREEKAVVTVDLVTKTIDGFSSGLSKTPGPDSAQSIKNAYYNVVEDLNGKYGKAEYIEHNGIAYIDGLASVELIDFDGDDTEELVAVYRKSVLVRDQDIYGDYISRTEDKYYIEIYRYNGNKALLAHKSEGISNKLGDSSDMYYIIKSKNGKSYYCQNSFSSSSYGRVVNASSSILKFDGTSFVPQFRSSYYTDYGYTEYFLDDREVYKSAFNEKGYQVPFFNGAESYDTGAFKVTYLQRKLKNAGNMESTVSKTVNTIKKLNPSYSPQ